MGRRPKSTHAITLAATRLGNSAADVTKDAHLLAEHEPKPTALFSFLVDMAALGQIIDKQVPTIKRVAAHVYKWPGREPSKVDESNKMRLYLLGLRPDAAVDTQDKKTGVECDSKPIA